MFIYLHIYYCTPTYRLKIHLNEQNETVVIPNSAHEIAAADDTGHINDGSEYMIKDEDSSSSSSSSQKRTIHQSSCLHDQYSQQHAKKSTLNPHTTPPTTTTPPPTNSFSSSSSCSQKCVKCNEDDFGLMIACSIEGCRSRYHTSCMNSTQLRELETFKCHLH